MDSAKLLQLLLLIDADEAQLNIGARINEIRDLLNQNNESTAQSASEKLESLMKDLGTTRTTDFARTETEMLEQLEATSYFGRGLIQSLEQITSGRGFEIGTRLSTFRKERQQKYSQLTALKDAMANAGVEAYEQNDAEVAFSIPENLMSAEEVASLVTKFSQFLKAVQDAKPGAPDTKIRLTRVNNGSAEFYFGGDPTMIAMVLNMLSDLATVYLAMRELRKREKSNGTLSEEEHRKVDAVYEAIAKERLEKFLEETPDKVAKAASPETKVKIRNGLKLLLKWLPLGIYAEVVYSKSTETSPAKPKKIDAQLDKVREMYALPLEQLELPEPKAVVAKKISSKKKAPKSEEME